MWKIEVTDTFAGEANYCWVNRWELPSGITCKLPVGKHAPCAIMFIYCEF